MYVCICTAITEKDIHKAVGEGVSSIEKLSETTSVSKHCGCCAEHAGKVIEEALATQKCPKSHL